MHHPLITIFGQAIYKRAQKPAQYYEVRGGWDWAIFWSVVAVVSSNLHNASLRGPMRVFLNVKCSGCSKSYTCIKYTRLFFLHDKNSGSWSPAEQIAQASSRHNQGTVIALNTKAVGWNTCIHAWMRCKANIKLRMMTVFICQSL